LKHDLLKPMGLKGAADELMELISIIPDTLLKNRYRYEVLKRLNIDERELRYENKSRHVPSAGGNTQQAPEFQHVGSVRAPESDLASAERELLKFLFHEPAWLEQAVTSVDLAALSGGPERLVGCAILEALGDGKLPPDPNLLTPDMPPGSIVAREVLQRLQGLTDDGILKTEAQALSAAVAETPNIGSKLDPQARLDMLVRLISKARIYARHIDADLRWTHAKLNGDAGAEEQAWREVMELRKEMAKLKSAVVKEN
jgi:hypothetical protein